MKKQGLSETIVLDTFNTGQTEKSYYGGRWNAIKKYHGYEIGVNYNQKQSGQYVIVSVWKRGRR